jgi:predicted lipoprotein
VTVPSGQSNASGRLRKAAQKTARRNLLITIGAVAVLLIAMGLGTKGVSSDEASASTGKFSASEFADKNWDSKILPAILDRSEDLVAVSEAIQADAAAAGKEFGVVEGTSAPVFTVHFTGVAGAVEAGIMPVTVEGLPEGVSVRVQMGPAIMGTAIRDASGEVHYPQFTNQIDYQDAGSALNDKVKTEILTGIDAASLNGTKITMTGVFQLINPVSYLITPVQIENAR